MLVLSRRAKEAITFGDSITLWVEEVNCDEVKLRTVNRNDPWEAGANSIFSSRRKDESLWMSGDLSVRVIDIKADMVRLGITAPRDITIVRQELVKVRVVPLRAAIKDAKDFLNAGQYLHLTDIVNFLNAGQYLHLTDIVKRLSDWENREEISDLRVEPIQGMWELKEKGGILGRINVRVFFAYLKQRREVVVLGAFKKECEGQTPGHILLRMRNRLRIYLEELAA